jgi:hypothetical protein
MAAPYLVSLCRRLIWLLTARACVELQRGRAESSHPSTQQRGRLGDRVLLSPGGGREPASRQHRSLCLIPTARHRIVRLVAALPVFVLSDSERRIGRAVAEYRSVEKQPDSICASAARRTACRPAQPTAADDDAMPARASGWLRMADWPASWSAADITAGERKVRRVGATVHRRRRPLSAAICSAEIPQLASVGKVPDRPRRLSGPDVLRLRQLSPQRRARACGTDLRPSGGATGEGQRVHGPGQHRARC